MEPKKDYKWLIAALVAAWFSVLAVYYGVTITQNPDPVPTPTVTVTASPLPSPTPTPSATPTPTPSSSATTTPTPTPSPTSTVSAQSVRVYGLDKPTDLTSEAPSGPLALSLARNETTGRILKVSGCLPQGTASPGFTIKLYALQSIKTVKPSYTGARVGDYLDAVVPLTGCLTGWGWMDIGVDKAVPPGNYAVTIGDLPITITVKSFTIPDRPTMPLYVSLGSWALMLGHKMTTAGVQEQAALTMKYVNEMRANRIEPYNQMVVRPPVKADGTLDLDQWKDLGGSFRQTNLTGALAPTGLIMPNPSTAPADAFYKATEATIAKEPLMKGAWHYVMDEPTSAQMADVLARATLSKASAPSMETMVTTTPTTALAPVINHFVNEFEIFKDQPAGFWIYGACPSHGSCANGFTANPTGTPDLMIDQPTIHARMYPIVAYALGASAELYYNSVEVYGHTNPAMDPWVDQYLFGGNGDGQLFYPGITGQRGFTDNVPVASLRLKMLRQGMYDVEYLKANGKGSLVLNARTWAKNHSDIEAIRSAVK